MFNKCCSNGKEFQIEGSCANDCRFEYTLYAGNDDHGTLFRLEEEPGVGTYIFNSKI